MTDNLHAVSDRPSCNPLVWITYGALDSLMRALSAAKATECVDTESVSDTQLMAQLSCGRRDALDELMRRHSAALFSCLRRRVRVHETVEDLFQETWIRVVERAGTFRNFQSVRPWLYRVALNVVTDHMRREGAGRRGGKAEHLDLEAAADVAAPMTAPTLMEVQERNALHDAVNALPEPFREVVRLRYFEELSTQEVAEVLDCAEGTVKSRLSRGLVVLQAELEKKS